MIYAIVESGGKQYKAVSGRTIEVDRLPLEAGKQIELKDVLLVSDGETAEIGKPTVAGAKVVATVLEQFKAPKVLVFKYKSRQRYRVKQGHRQQYTRLMIEEIISKTLSSKRGDEEAKAPAEKEKPKVKSAAKTKAKTKTKAAPKTESKTKTKTKTKAAPKTKSKSKTKTKTKTSAKAAPKTKSKTKTKAAPKSKTKTKSKTKSKTKTKSSTKSSPKTKTSKKEDE